MRRKENSCHSSSLLFSFKKLQTRINVFCDLGMRTHPRFIPTYLPSL